LEMIGVAMDDDQIIDGADLSKILVIVQETTGRGRSAEF